MLAICIWEGGGSDSRWSDAANWAGGLVPGIDDDLVFRGAVVTQTENDLPAGTAFGSLSFLSSDFSIAGNSLGVSNRIFVGPQASGATIAAEVALNGAVLATIVGGPLSFSGGVSGSGSLTENGNGVLVLASTATFTGSTTIHSGATLQLGSPAALPGRRDTGPVKINGALDLAGYNATVEGLSGRGLVTTSVPGLVTLRVDTTGRSSTFSGVIEDGAGRLALTTAGTGTLTLCGTNTFTGETIVEAGSTLRLGSPGALPGDPEVNGTLDLGGYSATLDGLWGSGLVTRLRGRRLRRPGPFRPDSRPGLDRLRGRSRRAARPLRVYVRSREQPDQPNERVESRF